MFLWLVKLAHQLSQWSSTTVQKEEINFRQKLEDFHQLRTLIILTKNSLWINELCKILTTETIPLKSCYVFILTFYKTRSWYQFKKQILQNKTEYEQW